MSARTAVAALSVLGLCVSVSIGGVSRAAAPGAAAANQLSVQPAEGTVRTLIQHRIQTTSYLSYDQSYPGGGTADPAVAASATRLAVATNSEVVVQAIAEGASDGKQLGVVQLHALFGVSAADEIVEPHIVYDGRHFFLSATEVDLDGTGQPVAGRMWLAWSSTALSWSVKPLTALSSTARYEQPIIATTTATVVVAATAVPLGGGASVGRLDVVQKGALVRSGALRKTTLVGGNIPAELAPAIERGSTTTLWLVALQGDHVALVGLTGSPAAGDVNVAHYSVSIEPVTAPPAPLQPGGVTVPIPPPRFVTAMWRAGRLWTVTVDQCTPSGAPSAKACLRLLGFGAADPATPPTLVHEFDVGDAAVDYYAPAVGITGYGDLVVAATESGAHVYPRIVLIGERAPYSRVTSHVHDLGFGLYRGRDFGGYAAVAPDPSDRAGIWTVAQEQLTDGSLDEPNWSAIAHEVAPSTAPARRHATPAFGTRTDGSASLMYRRADGRIEWLRWYDPCPNCWTRADVFTPLGGLTTSPALDPDLSPGEEDLFVRRADGHIWYHPAFSAWVDLGGRATSAPAVLAQPTSGDCQRAVLIRAVDGTVRQRTQHRFDSEWGPWRSLGGSVAAGSQPAAVYFGDDREAVFVRGPDDHVHWRRSGDCGATWGRWSDLGGNAHTNPAASSERQRQLDVFVAAADGVMYTRHFARGNWSRWTALGGKLSSGPAAAVPQVPLVFPNTRPWGTEVIAVGKHQRLWDDLRPANSTWTGWRPLYSAEVQGLFD